MGLGFSLCFMNVSSNIQLVKPIVVNAEGEDTTINGTVIAGIMSILLGYMGVTFATKYVTKTVATLWDNFNASKPEIIHKYTTSDFIAKGIAGSIAVGANAVNAAKDFKNWLISNYSLSLDNTTDVNYSDSSSVATGGTYLITSGGTFKNKSTSYSDYVITFSSPVRAINVGFYDSFVSLSPFTSVANGNTYSSSKNSYNGNTFYSDTGSSITSQGYITGFPYVSSADSTPTSAYRYCFGDLAVAPSVPLNDVQVHENEDNKLKDISLSNDQMLLLDGLQSILDKALAKARGNDDAMAADSDNVISNDDLNEALDDKVAADDKVTPINPAVPETYPLAIPSIPAVKPVPTTYDPPSSTTANTYGVLGLENFFPFCIPFDIYYLISALNATPVTPGGDFNIIIPGVVDYESHLDLSAFDGVAETFRNAELIAFVLGLLFVTRKLIRG